MKRYYFQYETEDDEEILIQTESKKTRDTIVKFIQAWFKPKNCNGFFFETSEENEGSFEEER